MKSSYKRDMNHNYLVLEPEGQILGNEYQIRMLSANNIEGLLKCNMKRMDGQAYFYYEVTSKQSLERSFEKSPMRIEDISRLLMGVKNSFENVSAFLLNPDNIIMDPEYIYLDIEKNDVYLCYLPSYDGTVTVSFRGLSEYILKKLDHNDTRAVAAGYDIYRQTGQDNYSIIQVIQSIYQIWEPSKQKLNLSADEKNSGSDGSRILDITDNMDMDNQDIACKDIKHKDITKEKVQKQSRTQSYLNKEQQDEDSQKTMQEAEHGAAGNNTMKPDNQKNKKITHNKPGIKNEKKVSRECKVKKNHITRKALHKNQNKDQQGSHRASLNVTLLTAIAGGIAIMLIIAAAFIFRFNTTQTGGLIFLILGSFGYLITAAGKRKARKVEPSRKAVQLESDWIEETVDDENYGEFFGETTTLNSEENQPLYLISMEPRTRGNIILRNEKLLIGKMKSKVDIVIELPIISRIHARLWKEEGCYYVEDLNSRNGTFLNGERLTANEKREIKPADELAFATACYYIGSS